MAEPIVTLARVRELLAYDPETGIFIWRLRKWKAGMRAGNLTCYGYRRIIIDGRKYQAHRLAWLFMTGDWPSEEIDHINGIRSDNRFANLRVVSRTLNCQNQRKPHRRGKTGFLGVHWCPSRKKKKFRSRIQADGRRIELGFFTTAEKAYLAYLAAKRKWHPGWTE